MVRLTRGEAQRLREMIDEQGDNETVELSLGRNGFGSIAMWVQGKSEPILSWAVAPEAIWDPEAP